MISHETIDTILQSVRIEEVVGEFVHLRRRGVNQIGLCPFHNEKTPSFTVSPAKGIYKCFGCGKAGNAVNFIMEHEHSTYPEALRFLAKKYNIPVEEEEQTPDQIREMNEKESLYVLNQFAQAWFTRMMHESDEGRSVGLSYFRERGLRDDMVNRFQLGYSPSGWDAFTKHALDSGYKREYLVRTGLSIEKDDRLYDRFHGRVIFPIHSASGRVIGFGGRILGEAKAAKYVNSPESEIYNKSQTLYGIYFARNAIVAKDSCLLVEGYTDVISLHQAGIANVVASSGTSLTHDQVRMIRRYTSNITILYDGDPAGIKASFRGIDMIVEQGLNVRIVLFPDGEDPDSFARKHHPDEVATFIEKNAVNFILFKTRLLLGETENDPIRKAALIREIVGTISLIPDGISRSLYVKECASLMTVSEQVLMTELNKLLRGRLRKGAPEGEPEPAEIGEEKIVAPPQEEIDLYSTEAQERDLIRVLLFYGHRTVRFRPAPEAEELEVNTADFIVHELSTDGITFENRVFASIYQGFAEGLENEALPAQESFLSSPDRDISLAAVNLLLTPYQLSPNWQRNNILVITEESGLFDTIRGSLLALKARLLDKKLKDIQQRLKSASTEEEERELLREFRDTKKLSNRINKEQLNRIVIR